MPLFLCFRGGVVRFSFFLGVFFGFVCFLLLGFALLEINSYLSKKKKNLNVNPGIIPTEIGDN